MAGVYFQAGALDALQHTTEAFLVDLFEEAQLAPIHAKRVRIMQKTSRWLLRWFVVGIKS